MSLHVTNRAEVVELGGILGDAVRALARPILTAAVAPVLAFARFVDDRLSDLGGEE